MSDEILCSYVLDSRVHVIINTADETSERATSIGIELTDEHWNVIEFVTNIYLESGYKIPKKRELRSRLKKNYLTIVLMFFNVSG